jgi:signal transduction histidine kinase
LTLNNKGQPADSQQALRLLIADDDPSLRKITSTHLKKSGYTIDAAPDGEEGIRLIHKNPPDIAVLDIMMPKIDGIQVLRTIRDNPETRNIYVIMLTAKDRPTDVVNGLNARADDYMTKPFRMPELVARVNAGARIRRLQLELEEKNALLQKAMDEQNRFFGLATHDLRAPLSIITTYSSLLGQEIIDDEEIRDVCLRRSKGMMKLIDDVLDITKIQSGQVDFNPEPTPLAPILADAAKLYEPVGREKGVSVRFREPAEKIISLCDAKRVSEIMENLLSNALNNTDNGDTVEIEASCEEGWAQITVRDSGRGISPTEIGMIFEPFRQANEETKPEAHTGLGLPIVKKLVELHGGEISAASDGKGRGATLRFTLPLASGGPGIS